MSNISIGIVIKAGKILLIKRALKEGNLSWQFPAGKIMENETPKDAVIREVFEETSIMCDPIDFLGERFVNDNVKAFYFLCTYSKGTVRPLFREVKKAKWKSINEVRGLITTDLFEPVNQKFSSIELYKSNVV